MSWNKYDSVLTKLFRHVERQNFVHIVQIGLSFSIVSLIILNFCVSTARKTMDPDQLACQKPVDLDLNCFQ